MRVLTLNDTDFTEACRLLEERCRPFDPDLVVGIATGGAVIAEQIFPAVRHLTVTARRPSSVGKGRLSPLMSVVRRLPVPVKNIMRMAESRILSFKRPVIPKLAPIDTGDAKRILVVDDAVDSGATLSGVLSAIRSEGTVRSAVITITTSGPIIRPDYSLYNNNTLIRFPWSMDNSPR
ncbi:MAG: phosphoribosyltransferase domain-containing protein [Muribaculaceae bacterium]|nr:phosphoribosyltransferase domain-containing protein [Muribaculaceae bacterium]